MLGWAPCRVNATTGAQAQLGPVEGRHQAAFQALPFSQSSGLQEQIFLARVQTGVSGACFPSSSLPTYCPIPYFPKRQAGAGCSSGPVNQFSGKETLNTPNAAYWNWVNSAHHSLLCCQKSLSLPQSRTLEDEGSHCSCSISPPTKRDPVFQLTLYSAPLASLSSPAYLQHLLFSVLAFSYLCSLFNPGL